ncbi:hypothetical protein RAS1_10430 [Phycisphaerae bacterium RAS1]|nr:hypothetical protein RAS1_10430 [Phycisphaerae bacterium RAS1]
MLKRIIALAAILSVCCLVAGASDRVTANEKGSVLIFPKIELRWMQIDSEYKLVQDTFIHLTNDFTDAVDVQLFFMLGDPPAAGEPGWMRMSNVITLQPDEPAFWSASTGNPKGVAPFTYLDPGSPPGRIDPEGSGQRVLRGYMIAFAVNNAGEQIRWNHIVGTTSIVNYQHGAVWEYAAYTFQALIGSNGAVVGTPGTINLDGIQFSNGMHKLLLDFQTAGSQGLSCPELCATVDTDLTLAMIDVDLRYGGAQPYTTKLEVQVWNEEGVEFSGPAPTFTLWKEVLLSELGGAFDKGCVGTDGAKARIDGVAFPQQSATARAFVALATKVVTFQEAPPAYGMVGRVIRTTFAGRNTIGTGVEAAQIKFDVPDEPDESNVDGLIPVPLGGARPVKLPFQEGVDIR